jgi:predicted RNA-binding protein with PUA domain
VTITWWDGAAWVVYPVVWCEHCKAPRPHHGPYCCSCGTDVMGVDVAPPEPEP